METTYIAAATCGAITVLVEPMIIPLLRKTAIDVPGPRSSHAVPTPRGGGAPIALGLLAAAAFIHPAVGAVFAIAVGAFGFVGFTEDIRGLTVRTRLGLQVAGSITVTALLVRHAAMAPFALAITALAITVWIVGYVNAFNFMDGVNGISGAHAIVGGLAYALLGLWLPSEFLTTAGIAVAAGALAFLPWNIPRARVFLGDAGSYALGAALAVLAAYALLHGIPLEAAVAPLGLYLADTTWTLLRRIRAGKSWHNHRTHVYQRWCDRGWSHVRVTTTTAAATALLVMLGTGSLTGSHDLRILADLSGACLLALYLASPALLNATAARPAETQPELG